MIKDIFVGLITDGKELVLRLKPLDVDKYLELISPDTGILGGELEVRNWSKLLRYAVSNEDTRFCWEEAGEGAPIELDYKKFFNNQRIPMLLSLLTIYATSNSVLSQKDFVKGEYLEIRRELAKRLNANKK